MYEAVGEGIGGYIDDARQLALTLRPYDQSKQQAYEKARETRSAQWQETEQAWRKAHGFNPKDDSSDG